MVSSTFRASLAYPPSPYGPYHQFDGLRRRGVVDQRRLELADDFQSQQSLAEFDPPA
jgi:hypothetical protein